MNECAASPSPDHAVPGIQDLDAGLYGRGGGNFGEQQPGPSGVIGLGVRDEAGHEFRRELVLFGPEGEGPAEISAAGTGQKEKCRQLMLT